MSDLPRTAYTRSKTCAGLSSWSTSVPASKVPAIANKRKSSQNVRWYKTPSPVPGKQQTKKICANPIREGGNSLEVPVWRRYDSSSPCSSEENKSLIKIEIPLRSPTFVYDGPPPSTPAKEAWPEKSKAPVLESKYCNVDKYAGLVDARVRISERLIKHGKADIITTRFLENRLSPTRGVPSNCKNRMDRRMNDLKPRVQLKKKLNEMSARRSVSELLYIQQQLEQATLSDGSPVFRS